MTSGSDYDIVVVGAGIAGAALGCALAQSSLRIAVIEAGPVNAGVPAALAGVDGFDSRVSALTVASSRWLAELGVWQGIESGRCRSYRHMSVWDAEGTGSIEFDADEVAAPALGHIVENRLIVAALQAQLARCPGVDVLSPVRLEGIDRDESDLPQLRLDDGSVVRARLVVGADGALSRVRQWAEFETREWDYGHQALVCTVETTEYHNETAWQRFLPTGPLAFLPLPSAGDHHYCSIVWSAELDLAEELLALDTAAFCQRLGDAFEQRLGPVIGASQRFGFPLRQRHAVHYVQNGIALVGDAAHTIHPLAGQGINLGLQDVAALSRELLAATDRGQSPGDITVLRRYQRQRKGENLAMMAAMDGFRHVFGRQDLPLRWLRNAGLRWVGGSGPLKQQIMKRAMGLS